MKGKEDTDLNLFLLFFSIVFTITGMGTYLYCLLGGLNPFMVAANHNPIFFLMFGLILMVVYIIRIIQNTNYLTLFLFICLILSGLLIYVFMKSYLSN